MPKVHKKKARFDTYNQGLKIKDSKTKSGYRIDKSKPRDKQDTLFCKKGDIYYSWKFRYGPVRKSLSYPKDYQLTSSEFLIAVYVTNEEISEVDENTLNEEFRDEILQRLEELRDEQDEKINNMPEQLQSSDTGELLQQRYDELESMISDLESLDFDDDIESVLEEFKCIQYQGY